MYPTLSMTPWLANALVAQAAAMTSQEVGALQKERLLILLDHARRYSPFFAKKYAHLPTCPELRDLPPTRREEAMPLLDDWLCDRDIRPAALDAYLSQLDEDSISKPFLDRYRVLITSGTTGVPLRMVRDQRHNLIHAALLQHRLLGGSKTQGQPILDKPWPRMAGVLADGNYHSTYLSYLRTRQAYRQAGRGDDIIPLFLQLSTSEMVERLNAFQPELLTGYPSNLRVLASQQRQGRLRIAPSLIACSAEHLSLVDLLFIEESFQCPVQNNYCSTEGGEVACLCRENRLHLNADWVLVEPVDEELRPVPTGVESAGLLLTNLANLVQPVIRYHVSDRIILDDQTCACGSPFPSLQVEGRKEDLLRFRAQDGSWVELPSALFITISLQTPHCSQVQFIQRGPVSLEIRAIAEDGWEQDQLLEVLHVTTQEQLAREGLDQLQIHTSREKPLLGKSGKMRNTLQLQADQTKGEDKE